MKIKRLETHDRLLELQRKQAQAVSEGCDECLKRNPLSLAIQARSPYVYIFGHPRTADDGYKTRFLWQPRLTKPKAQTNSYLFRAKSNTDLLEICWMIPPRELWNEYKKGNITAHEWVTWSINQFRYNRAELEKSYPDDLPEEKCKLIMLDIARSLDEELRMKKMYSMQAISEESSTS